VENPESLRKEFLRSRQSWQKFSMNNKEKKRDSLPLENVQERLMLRSNQCLWRVKLFIPNLIKNGVIQGAG
jgi:hypothetical protein